MERLFLDSSALVKYFVQEPGSAAVEKLLVSTATDRVYVAMVTGAEVVAALKRAERMAALTADQAEAAIQHFLEMWQAELIVVAVDETIVGRAMELARRRGLRGYDAIQLACAADLAKSAAEAGDAVTLWSSDSDLLAAAQVEGLAVVNPAGAK